MELNSQDDVLSLLEEFQLGASDDVLAGVCFQLRALLPECNGSESLVELSSLLLQSNEYYRIAVPLVRIILQDDIKLQDDKSHDGQSDPLQGYVSSRSKYEAKRRFPSLRLRHLLVKIAAVIAKSSDVEVFMNFFARHTLSANPDRFKADSSYQSMLKLFEKLIIDKKFGPDGNDLSELHRILLERGKKQVIQKYLDDFSTLEEYPLAVMDVELKVVSSLSTSVSSDLGSEHYCQTLIDTYKVMPDFPIGQWPPIKKVHYVNLALITSDPMPRNDYYSRATVRGSIDDVLLRKEPTSYDKVFSDVPKSKSRERMLILIEGRPACGKSTLLTKVSKDWSNGEILQDMKMLVLVRLRQCLGKKKLRLEDIFGRYCTNSQLVSKVIDEVTKTGGKGVCLLLDGLDEYGPSRNAENLIKKLLVGELLPNASIITASRPAGSVSIRHSLKLSKHVEIIGFLDKEIRAYVEHAFQDDKTGKASRLLSYLQKHPNIARMCYLPLHLAMVVYLFDQGQALPDAETDLYYNFTLHTLHRSFIRAKVKSQNDDEDHDDDEDDVEVHDLSYIPDERKQIFQSICLLAFRATTDQKQIFTGKEIIEMEDLRLPVKFEKKAFDSLGLLTVDHITADNSLLLTKTFSFLHLTLQEFLSACHLLYFCDTIRQLDIIKSPVGRSDHMWVVWKFYCGLSQKRRVNSTPSFFTKAFHEIAEGLISSKRRISSLTMVHCAFESKNVDACIDLVTQLQGRMDVNDITLTPSDCAAVGKVTSSAHSHIKEIDLSYCHIGPEGIGALVDQLENTLEAVELFRLRARIDRALGTEGAAALTKLLGKLPNLEELRLYGNKLTTVRFQYLAPIIRDMTKLQTFIVSRNDLDEDSGSHVSNILENLPHLHSFYISYNLIRDKGLGEMKPGLLKCKKLNILGLRGTGLTGKSGVHLMEIFENLPKLNTVELYQNKLGDTGVVDMLPGLRKARSLRTMSLVENDIGERGALAMANFLEFTDTLLQLRIFYNYKMTEKGKIALRSSVVNRTPELTKICDLRVAV